MRKISYCAWLLCTAAERHSGGLCNDHCRRRELALCIIDIVTIVTPTSSSYYNRHKSQPVRQHGKSADVPDKHCFPPLKSQLCRYASGGGGVSPPWANRNGWFVSRFLRVNLVHESPLWNAFIKSHKLAFLSLHAF